MRPSRRRLTEQGADLVARNERLLAERDDAREEASAYKAAAETGARQFAEADAANVRLHGRILELGRRISQLTESDPEYAAQLEGQVAELQKRVKHLEMELDNACGMPSGGILNSAPWQPGYKAERDKTVTP